MADPLTTYLAAHPHHAEYAESWPVQGNMRVRLSLAQTLPPEHVRSSILAIVLNTQAEVLYLWPSTPTGNIAHLTIGGRPNPGETPQQTAAREVAEETGWRIQAIAMVGFRYFHQLEPFNPKSDRPYPDFIQPIYAAIALCHNPDLLLPADHIASVFVPLTTAEHRLEPAQRPLLRAAVAAVNRCRTAAPECAARAE